MINRSNSRWGFLLLVVWVSSLGVVFAQDSGSEILLERLGMADLRDGDLIFQEWNCGEGCSAISWVTRSAYGRQFTHCGLFYRDAEGTLKVLEAVGRGVVSTELQDFLSRTNEWSMGRVLVGRTDESPQFLQEVLAFALAQLGRPYDEVFALNNQRWYCSELLDAAFASANAGDTTYFGLQPMTFKNPGSREIMPYWQHYFDSLGVEVPEGAPGINPGSLSRSTKLRHALLDSAVTPGTMDAMVLSTLFVQRSAEYQGLCRQIYRGAAQQLKVLLDSVQEGFSEELRRRPPAVVLDLDETVLDNSPYAGWQIRHGSSYQSASWQAWVQKAEATAVPGVQEYLLLAQHLGLKVVFLSNRKRSQWEATKKNLLALNLPVDGLDSMLLRQNSSDKQGRRDSVKLRYTVLQWVGDNLLDMDGFKGNLSEEAREQALQQGVHRLGRDWILLPNPVYGPWEDLWHQEANAKDRQRLNRLVQRLRFFRP
ncbi:MAG: HAD family acid phosphatase [Bacteroidia bacterium]